MSSTFEEIGMRGPSSHFPSNFSVKIKLWTARAFSFQKKASGISLLPCFFFKSFDILQSFHFFLCWVCFSVVEETPTTAVVETKGPPQPEPEVEKVGKPVVEGEKEATAVEDEKVAESASFKEESNKVDDLIDPEKRKYWINSST
ncbi:patellin-3-like [Forsythia ovata]|uniref:Patellin-3-like n=1 Tax=Forsythia ovata TaxID=205694 RepID=A0ABD1PVW5_9LAMI